ncbi:MAG: hypothetical protein ABSG08_19485, partial [Terriglobales bacterium]
SNCCSSFPRMPSSYQVVLWKQESFVVLRPLHIEFFRNLLDNGQLLIEKLRGDADLEKLRLAPRF